MINTGDLSFADSKALSTPEHQTALSQFVQTQAEKDALSPAPSGVGQRIWDVTREGINKIPEGFVHSLDTHQILTSIGTGLLMGAASRALLSEFQPLPRVIGEAMTAYFLGKPVVECYHGAVEAKTMADMHRASSILGVAVGGMPVSMLEGAIGTNWTV